MDIQRMFEHATSKQISEIAIEALRNITSDIGTEAEVVRILQTVFTRPELDEIVEGLGYNSDVRTW